MMPAEHAGGAPTEGLALPPNSAEAGASVDPVVFVIGPTGSGKSKLGIDIVRHLASKGRVAEVINADVMQMYTGLPVATNNVTGDEAEGVAHHFLAYVDPIEQARRGNTDTLSVIDFVEQAEKLISTMQGQGKIPVVVGGTNYYVQSLMFRSSLVEGGAGRGSGCEAPPDSLPAGDSAPAAIPSEPPIDLETATAKELHDLLKEVDPAMAAKYHPNDIRRVKRSLEVTFEAGERHSSIISKQDREMTRYEPAGRNLVFWVDAERSVLNTRLDDRVDDMIKRDVFEEVKTFWRRYCEATGTDAASPCPTKGIFGAIGFKELYRSPPEGEPVTDEYPIPYEAGVELMKTNTRRYARQQVQWIKHRFCTRGCVTVYRVDSSNKANWAADVSGPALSILDGYLRDGAVPELAGQYAVRQAHNAANEPGSAQMFTCGVCPNKVLAGTEQWELHVQSRKHRALVKKKERAPFVEEQKRKRQRGAESQEASGSGPADAEQ